ncbi:MAG: TonB-dependent receptor domain-containing protein [Nevskiales bacterium]
MASRSSSGREWRSATLLAALSWVLVQTPVVVAQDELDFLFEDEQISEGATPPAQPSEPEAAKPELAPPSLAPSQSAETSPPAPSETAQIAPSTDAPTDQSKAKSRPSSSRVIEEVVVTAQKRAQAEIDVPISISVIDDKFIAEQGITDLRDLAAFVPNAKIQTTAVFPDIRIRGFGTSPLNPVFEQSVGLVLDGIPFGNKAYYQAALFDIDHVEVLRGPQGALHGKNTTAGLINILTKAPTDELTGFLDVQNGDLEHRRIEGGLGGPLLQDVLNFRFALLDEQRDEYFENTTALTNPTAPDNPGARDRQAFRFKLELPDIVGSKLQLSYEESDADLFGGYELHTIPEHTRSFIRRFDPNADFERNNFIGSFDHPDGIQIGVKSFIANWSDDWNGWGVTAVGGRAELDEALQNDTDFSPVPVSFTLAGRSSSQTTFELRTDSPRLPGLFGLDSVFGKALGETDFTFGVFSQQREISNLFSTLNINDLLLVEFLIQDQTPQLGPVLGPLLNFILPLLPSDLETGDLLRPLVEEQTTIFYDDQGDTRAAFGQFNWYFLPEWTFTGGLRWSEEQKQAHIRRQFDTQNTLLLTSVLMWEEFDREVEREESQVSPKISLNYKPSDDVSLFLSWGNAYKAGGFNAFASGGSDEELIFEPEIVEQVAFDAKLRFFDGAAKLNISVFRMELEDFQVLTANPGNLRITIENAAKARAQGAEADFTWLATDWLTLIGTLGYNDSEFLEFPIGTCPQDRENSDGDSEPRCDLSGKPLPRAPKRSGTLTSAVTLPFSAIPFLGSRLPSFLDNIGFAASLTAEYQDEQFLNDDLDERKRQDEYYRYRASFGVGDVDQTWSLRVTGENLTNEPIAIAIAEIPAVAPGHFYQIPDSGRVVFVQFRYNY